MYEFTRLQLTRNEFDNLVFMGEPPWWRNLNEYPPCWDKEKHPERFIAEGQEFLSNLCLKPLKEVARRVIDEGNAHVPTIVFEKIRVKPRCDEEPWFRNHARLSRSFNKHLMGKLWIRNLTSHERESSPNGTFYIEDGNHRALVYAVHLELRRVNYEALDVIHATSWDLATGILGHEVQHANNLEYDGKLQYDRYFKEKFNLPLGSTDVQIDTYRRS